MHGESPPDPLPPLHPPEDPYPSDRYPPDDTGGGGEDAPSEPTAPPPLASMCQATSSFLTKNYTDALGVEAARQILGNFDHRRIEFGAIIYRDTHGTIRLSGLVCGEPGKIPGFPSEVLGELGLPGSAVLGVIHNHPSDHFTSEQERIANRNPSENDRAVALALVNAGVHPDMLQMYIVGPDNHIREFEFAKRNTYEYRRVGKVFKLVTGAELNKNMPLPKCEVTPWNRL